MFVITVMLHRQRELKPLATRQRLVSIPRRVSDILDPTAPRGLINRWQKALTPRAAGRPARCLPAALLHFRASMWRAAACSCEFLNQFTFQARRHFFLSGLSCFFFCLHWSGFIPVPAILIPFLAYSRKKMSQWRMRVGQRVCPTNCPFILINW